jgi:hypothetical protein
MSNGVWAMTSKFTGLLKSPFIGLDPPRIHLRGGTFAPSGARVERLFCRNLNAASHRGRSLSRQAGTGQRATSGAIS